MNILRFNSGLKQLLVSSFLGMSVYAATIVDTGLKSSPSTATANLINPNGISLTAATGSTAEATVEAISGLKVIQDFSASLTGGTNVFAFTDSSLPDIQTSFSTGVTTTTGVRLTNSAFLTSGSDSMRIQGNSTGTFVMVIDFGVWSGSSFSGTGGTVSAAAFTLRGNGSEFSSFVAEFLDASNAVISTQTLGGTNGYFGLSSAGTPISSIVLTFNPIGSNDGPLGFDDLAFAPSGGGGGSALFSDDFNDGNANGWTTSGGTWSVNANEYLNTTSGLSYAGDAAWTNYSVEVDVSPILSTYSGIIGRYQSNTNYYQLEVHSGNNKLSLWRNQNGTWTEIGSYPTTINNGTWYLLKLDMNGSTIRGYLNGVERINVTDTVHSAGKIALRCGNDTRYDDIVVVGSSGGGTGPVAAPQLSPTGGTFSGAINVTITSSTSGASIRYTTNGSTPSSTSGTLYSSPVAISATTTLKAIAYKTGMTNSTVTTGAYTITVPSGPLYGARGAWPSATPAATATPKATYSNLNDLKIALRTANPGDVFHLSSFNQTTAYNMTDATAKARLAAFGPTAQNVLVRPAPGAIVDFQAQIESFLPNITWAYFKLNSGFAFREGSDHSRLARIQMGPSSKLSATASRYLEFVECLKPVRGINGDTMQVNSTRNFTTGILGPTPRDILWESCWLEGNTVVGTGQHSDTIQFLCSDGTMWFRNTYLGPAGNNAVFQFNTDFQPEGLPCGLFDMDTVFMGSAQILGNGNVLGAYDTPAIIRRVEYYQQLKSVPNKSDGTVVPFALPAVFEFNRVAPSDVTLAANVGGGSLKATFPNNVYGATVVLPTFIAPSWWNN